MGRQTAYAKVWLKGWDQEHNERCPSNFSGSCNGWIWHSNRVAKTWRGRQTRARCAKACGDKVQYAAGKDGHPCSGANTIRHINPSENLNDGANGAVECTWSSIDDNALRDMSDDMKYTNSSMSDKGSVYEQLLFGVRLGGYNTEGNGFCEYSNNLHKIVDKNGDTCYDKIITKLGDAVAKQEGIKYCEIDENKTDPKCKCINVSGNTFLQDCQNNPTWAGCDEILKGEADFKKLGLTSASGLYGNADCLSPGICSGDVYSPMTNLPACSNKNAICNQILQQDNIKAYAGLNTAQHCNIDFEAEQAKKDESTTITPSTPSGTPSTPSGGIRDYIPRSVDEFKTDTKKQITVGGGLFLMCCCLLIIILLASSGGNGGGGGRFQRFRR